MKLSLVAWLAVTTGALFAAPYDIDTAHTDVGFSIKHLMVSSTKGAFKTFEGGFDFDQKTGVAKNIHVEIDAASIDTREEKRDEHLRSADFFDTTKYPKITFKADEARFELGKPVKVNGILTIKGVSKPVVLDVVYNGHSKDPYGNEHIGFDVNTEINRKDFNITWNKALDQGGVAVGNEVKINIPLEAVAKTEPEKKGDGNAVDSKSKSSSKKTNKK